MHELKKYPSIQNYKKGNYKTLFLIQEKLDGCNIQLEFTPNGKMVAYSRTMVLDSKEKQDKLFGLGTFLENEFDKNFIEYMKNMAIEKKTFIRLAGEFFGDGIQHRIKYTKNGKQILFFDVFINDEKLSPFAYDTFMFNEVLMPHAVKHILTERDNIEEVIPALNNFKSHYSEEKSEGYVIKSKDLVVKYKNPEFNEKENKNKKPREPKDYSGFVYLLDYLNENRVYSAKSKLGVFDISRMGEFLKEVSRDISDEIGLDSKDGTNFLNKNIAQFLKEMYKGGKI